MIRALSLAAALAAVLGWAPAGLAQDKPKDADLERLLERAEGRDKADAPDAKKADAKKADEPGDKDLDNLLRKLGETPDAPTAAGRPAPAPGGDKPSPRPGKPDDAAQLKGEKKQLDEVLEIRAGRRKKRPQDDQDDSAGMMGEAVKKMREVEKRLSQPDTGEETRKKQQEIVKEIDRLLDQIRKAAQAGGQGQGQRGKTLARVRMPGRQPGNQPGGPGSQGTDAKGVGPQRPQKPQPQSVVSVNKDEWGALPPQLREEMLNVFKTEPLPGKKTLIDRYYLSVNKKSLDRREGSR